MDLDPDAVIWNLDEAERAGLPLIVLLHGLGASEHDLVPLIPALPAGFAIASVRAPFEAPPGAAWFPPEDGPDLARTVDEGTDALLGWLRSVAPRHPSVGLLGFSQGGAIAVHALRRDPGIAAWVVSLAGFLPGQADDSALEQAHLPVFIGYGLADDVVPMAWTQMLIDWAEPRVDLETRFYPGLTHAVSEEELADVAGFIRRHS